MKKMKEIVQKLKQKNKPDSIQEVNLVEDPKDSREDIKINTTKLALESENKIEEKKGISNDRKNIKKGQGKNRNRKEDEIGKHKKSGQETGRPSRISVKGRDKRRIFDVPWF